MGTFGEKIAQIGANFPRELLTFLAR
jgi:hypothetical protein